MRRDLASEHYLFQITAHCLLRLQFRRNSNEFRYGAVRF
jgi:hypothetical protein